jgi:hypothetical protein
MFAVRLPGDSAMDGLQRRSRQARCGSLPALRHDPGHGGHGTCHGDTFIHGAGQSNRGDEERSAGPVSAAASAPGKCFSSSHFKLGLEN